MKDIKFRIRNINEKKFEDLRFITMVYDNAGIEVFTDDGDILENYELNQYTGLKDKNGKEIYEGDIVKFIDEYSCETECGIEYDEFENTGYIFYDKDTLAFDITGRNMDREDILDFNLEVIGNVYENSELLGDDVNV